MSQENRMNNPFSECSRNKKILAAVILFLIAGLTIAAVVIMQGPILTAPEITVLDVDISKITLDETKLDVILLINNKNLIGGTVNDLSFDIIWDNNGENNLIAHGEKSRISIEGNQITKVDIPLDFYNKNIIPLALTTLAEDSLNMTVKGNAELEFFFFRYNFPFEENKIIETDYKNIISGILKFIN